MTSKQVRGPSKNWHPASEGTLKTDIVQVRGPYFDIQQVRGRYFVANKDLSRFTHFLEIFGQKKCLFGSKTVFLGQEVHYYMVYIAYFTELILQICDYAQKRRIWRENCKYALDENLHCHFCSRRMAAKFCHPAVPSSFREVKSPWTELSW